MALPAGITPKTVTVGIASFFDGSLANGRVTISAPVNVVHGPTNRPIFSSDMQQRFVDGAATFTLAPTDAPGLNRVDWTYKLRVEVDGAIVQPEVIYFTLPAAGPDTVDLDSLVTVPSSAGIPISVNAVTVADINTPTSDTAVALRAAFVPKWKPSTAYAAGEFVLNPSGQIVSANTAFTSAASYSSSNWTVISGGGASLPTQTGNGGKFLTTDGSAASWGTPAGGGSTLTPTATKTANYTAAVGDLAVMNVAGGATTLTLPATPADKAQVGFRAVGATTSAPLVVNRGGSDTIGDTGATSVSLPLSGEVTVYQYQASGSRWLPLSNVKPLTALDARFVGSANDAILSKVDRVLRSKIRPNQGIAVELNGTSYRLWQRLSPAQWMGTYLDVRTNTNGGPVNIITQVVIVTPSVLVSQGNASITQVGTWTTSTTSVWSATATDSQTYTTPANTTSVGVEYLRTTNGGLSKVSINGDASRARLLPSAQDLVERGTYPKTILVANGGTLQPTDRVIDHYWNGGALQTVNVLAAEDLPPTAGGHVITLNPTGYQQTASTGARSYFVGFLHRQAQTLGDTTALQVLTLDGGAGSATEYAISAKPPAGSYSFMGCIHDNEAQDSISVSVDGTATTLTSGVIVNPTNEVVITRTSHLLHPGATGAVANIVSRYILNRDGIVTDETITWAQSMTVNAAYSMLPLNGKLQVTGSAVRAFFDRGDLLENAAGPLRIGQAASDLNLGTSKSAAAWAWDSQGRIAAGMYVEDILSFTNNWGPASGNLYANIEDRNGTLTKIYVSRVGSGATQENVVAGTVWAWRTHYLFGLMDSPERTFAA